MDDSKLFEVDLNNMTNEQKKVLLSSHIAYVKSCEEYVKHDAVHKTDIRVLASFLVVLVLFLTVGIKLETACLAWTSIQFISSVASKLMQFYYAQEMERTKKNFESIIKLVETNEQ